MKCSFCEKVCKNDNSLRNHQRLCKSNPNRQVLQSNLINYNKLRKENGIKGSNQYTKAAKLGLPKPVITDETRLKLSNASKGKYYSDERKLKHSIAMKRAVELHPDSYTKNNVVGRVKNIQYNGITLKGSWEVMVAKWLDKNNIKWNPVTTPIEYEWKGIRKYYPDFYLPDYNLYIEVKGYQRDRDLAKWKCIPNLIVFKLKEIKEIKEDNFYFDFNRHIGVIG
jgi:hypothetical protein